MFQVCKGCGFSKIVDTSILGNQINECMHMESFAGNPRAFINVSKKTMNCAFTDRECPTPIEPMKKD